MQFTCIWYSKKKMNKLAHTVLNTWDNNCQLKKNTHAVAIKLVCLGYVLPSDTN